MNSPDNSVRNKTTNPKEPKWRLEGEDPDYRFSLANERTFLAWMRTALAILAAGVLLDQFSVKLGSQVFVVLAPNLLFCPRWDQGNALQAREKESDFQHQLF